MATLTAVKKLDSTQAQLALADAVQQLLPHPYEIQPGSELSQTILSEVRHQLQIDEMDQTHEAKSRILKVLSDEIAARVLPRNQITRTENRLGRDGLLPLGAYRHEISKEFAQRMNEVGPTRGAVRPLSLDMGI